jgi:hypothetical protein
MTDCCCWLLLPDRFCVSPWMVLSDRSLTHSRVSSARGGTRHLESTPAIQWEKTQCRPIDVISAVLRRRGNRRDMRSITEKRRILLVWQSLRSFMHLMSCCWMVRHVSTSRRCTCRRTCSYNANQRYQSQQSAQQLLYNSNSNIMYFDWYWTIISWMICGIHNTQDPQQQRNASICEKWHKTKTLSEVYCQQLSKWHDTQTVLVF